MMKKIRLNPFGRKALLEEKHFPYHHTEGKRCVVCVYKKRKTNSRRRMLKIKKTVVQNVMYISTVENVLKIRSHCSKIVHFDKKKLFATMHMVSMVTSVHK